MANGIFFTVCTLLDLVISVLFPGSYRMNDLVFISSLGFCSLVLVIREYDLLDRCLMAFLYGLIVDLFIMNTFLLYACTYLLIPLLLQLWSRHMGGSVLESVILCIATIFVKDLLIFFYMRMSGISELSFAGWIVSYEFLSIIGNGVLVFAVVLLQRIKNDYQRMKAGALYREQGIVSLFLSSCAQRRAGAFLSASVPTAEADIAGHRSPAARGTADPLSGGDRAQRRACVCEGSAAAVWLYPFQCAGARGRFAQRLR